MSSFWNFLFGILLVVIWVVAGGFVTQASVYLTPYKDTDDLLHRAYWFTFWAAFVTWFLVGLFILLIILSVLGVVALFGSGVGEAGVAVEGAEGAGLAAEGSEGAEGAESLESNFLKRQNIGNQSFSNNNNNNNKEQNQNEGISWFTIGFLIFALILVAITGVLAAIAASSMVQSTNFDPSISKLKTAYNDCIIAASLCLGAGGLLIIGIIVYFAVGHQRERKTEADRVLREKQKQLNSSQVDQLKQQALREQLEQQILQTQLGNPTSSQLFSPTSYAQLAAQSYLSSQTPQISTQLNQQLTQEELQQALIQSLSRQASRYLG